MRTGLLKPLEAKASIVSGTGITGSCEPPSMAVESQTGVLCKYLLLITELFLQLLE